MDFSALEKQYNLPAGILSRMEQTESGGDQYAQSSKGAQGYFQFLPGTAKQYNVDPYNLDSAAQGAARYLADLYKQTGSWEKAVAAYNWGPGNLEKQGYQNAPPETKAYVRKVMDSNAGPTLTKVNYDPFAQNPQPKLTKVNYDPFKQAAPKTPAATEQPWYSKAMDVAKAAGEGSYALVRGGATGLLGAPGDLEHLLTQDAPQLWGQKPTTQGPWGTGTVFPTSDTVSKGLTKIGLPSPQGHALAQGVGNFVGGMALPMHGVTELAEGPLKNAGIVSRVLGGKPPSEDAAALVSKAQGMGYKVPPSDATGNSRFLQDITNFGAGKGAANNRGLFDATLKKTMGIPESAPVSPKTLATAGQQIPQRFLKVIKGKTVNVPPETANIIQNIVKTNPQAAAEIVGDPALKVLAQGAESGEVAAPAWFEAIKRLKDMQYSTTNNLDKLAYKDLVEAAEKPFFATGTDTQKAYRVFNRQYRAYATAVNATRGSTEFAQSGAIAPERMLGVLEKGAKTPQALSRLQTTKAPFDALARDSTVLGLLGKPKPLSESALLNTGIAAGHASGLIGHAGLYSENSGLKSLISAAAGGTLRRFYESPAGQAALRGKRALTPAEITALTTLLKGASSSAAAYRNNP